LEITAQTPEKPYIRLIFFKSRKGIKYKMNNADGG